MLGVGRLGARGILGGLVGSGTRVCNECKFGRGIRSGGGEEGIFRVW